MSGGLQHIHMQYTPEWFHSGYYVYVITVEQAGAQRYYIGQTGDRNHLSSRSPFYRLWGHFNPYRSTDSQLFEYLHGALSEFPDKSSRRLKVERALADGIIKVKADYFKIDDLPETLDKAVHKIRRKQVEDIELLIIQALPKDQLINKNLKTGIAIDNDKAREYAQKILNHLNISNNGMQAQIL